MQHITPLEQLDVARFESPAILKKLAISSRVLAELEGIAGGYPKSKHSDQHARVARSER